MKKLTPPLLLVALLVALLAVGAPAAAQTPAPIDPALQAQLDRAAPGEHIPAIVILAEQVQPAAVAGRTRRERRRNLLSQLRAVADRRQPALRAQLSQWRQAGRVSAFTPLWVIDAIAVRGDRGVIEALAGMAGVARLAADTTLSAPTLGEGAPAEPNLAAIGAPALWSMGFSGQGVVVANLDTGVDATHPDLAGRYRGGSNSWFDPFGQYATPGDANGHGTWTMGVMVGGSSGGTAIGAAPQARWIAARIFNSSGASSISVVHQAYQWALDPDGNPATDDTPDVVNSSWAFGTPGCDTSFAGDIQALLAAGILPVFAAGNAGPGPGTSVSPANNPGAFAVGATDNGGAIYGGSSRGPNGCDGATYPTLVAPGIGIYTSDLYSLYYTPSGTSVASPHAAGGLALLLSAFPELTAEQQRSALLGSALDLGATGADNTYGAGMLNLQAAYNLLAGGAIPTATPALPTATLPPPSATPVPPTPTLPPTATPVPPTATPVPPTATATSAPPQAGAIFSDGFESGTLGFWSTAATNGGQLSVTGSAALEGAQGLQAQIASTRALYVADRSPAAEPRYRARFSFDPNGVSIASGRSHTLLLALNGIGGAVARVQVRSAGGAYQLRAGIADDGGAQAFTSWYALSDAPHRVELSWGAASPGASDGFVTLIIDGAPKQTRGGVSNGQQRVEEVRLGPTGVSSGIAGVEYYDTFASTRGEPIAP